MGNRRYWARRPPPILSQASQRMISVFMAGSMSILWSSSYMGLSIGLGPR